MQKQKVVFLDRDGVLNTERKEYTYSLDHFSIVAGIGEALAALRDRGFIFVVATNQSGIAKGIYKHEDMNTINNTIAKNLKEYGVEIKEWYYCPHHNTISTCTCRKPDSGMLERGIARFNADKSKSWFIGDKERDIEAGKKAGLRTLKIESNEDLRQHVEFLAEV